MRKCPYCESELSDTAKFCGNCGASVSDSSPAPEAPTDAPAAPETSAEEVNNAPGMPARAPKKSKKKIIIPIVIAAVLVLGAAGFVFRGALKQLILPADKYIQSAVKSDVKNVADAASAEFGILNADEKENLSPKIELGMKLEDSAIDLIGEFFKEYGFKDTNPMESLKKFDSADIVLSASSEEDLYGFSGKALLNGKDFLTGNVILDSDSKKVYYSIPELCEKYGWSDASELFPEDEEINFEELKSLIPSEEKVNAVITRYGDVIADSMTDVKKGSETVEAAGISQKLNTYTVTYTPEQLKALAVKLLDTLENDEDIKEILEKAEKIESLKAENCCEEFIKAIDSAKKEVESSEMSDGNIVIVIYKDMWGNNAGAVLNAPYDEMSVDNEGYFVVRDGRKIGVRAFYGYTVDEYCDVMSIEGSGTYNNGAVSLDLIAEQYDEKTLDISIRDMKISSDVTKGEIKLSIDEERLETVSGVSGKLNDFLKNFAFGIKLDTSLEAKKANAEYIIYNGEEALLSMNFASSVEKGAEKLSKTLDSALKDALGEEEWVKEIDNADAEKILEKKLDEAGITEDDIASLEEILGMFGSIFDPYDYEDVYDDWDTEDEWGYDPWGEYPFGEYSDDWFFGEYGDEDMFGGDDPYSFWFGDEDNWGDYGGFFGGDETAASGNYT